MKRTDAVGMMLEGIFMGIACLILWLVFQDARAREPWSKKELVLFGLALGAALAGCWIESAL